MFSHISDEESTILGHGRASIWSCHPWFWSWPGFSTIACTQTSAFSDPLDNQVPRSKDQLTCNTVLKDDRSASTWFKASLKIRDDQWPLLDKRPCQPKLLTINSGDVNYMYQHHPVVLKDTTTPDAHATQLEKNTSRKLPVRVINTCSLLDLRYQTVLKGEWKPRSRILYGSLKLLKYLRFEVKSKKK